MNVFNNYFIVAIVADAKVDRNNRGLEVRSHKYLQTIIQSSILSSVCFRLFRSYLSLTKCKSNI